MPKRVSTFSDDLVDGAILCQMVASHAPHLVEAEAPLDGFIPVYCIGKRVSLGKAFLILAGKQKFCYVHFLSSNAFISFASCFLPSVDRITKGELSDESNRRQNVSKFLRAMVLLRMDFGLTEEDMLNLSDRDGVLLALHLFQATILARSCPPHFLLHHVQVFTVWPCLYREYPLHMWYGFHRIKRL